MSLIDLGHFDTLGNLHLLTIVGATIVWGLKIEFVFMSERSLGLSYLFILASFFGMSLQFILIPLDVLRVHLLAVVRLHSFQKGR